MSNRPTYFESACVLFSAVIAACTLANPAFADKPIRVLITHGGHGFNAEAFFRVFSEMEGVTFEKCELPQQAEMLKPGLEKKYDVIVRYDMVKAVSPEQRQNFVALLNQGIGLVSLHHNLAAHRNWPQYRDIIGGVYLFKETEIDGEQQPASSYKHGSDIKIQVADPQHPLARGVEPFEIHDENYYRYYTSPDVHVVLKTDHENNDPEVAWVKQSGNSRVAYVMLGHDAHAWKNPAFSKIVRNAISWTAGRDGE